MGRNKLSSETKKARGTFQPSRQKPETKVIPLSRMPPVPDWIGDEGKRIWRQEGPSLLRNGLLTDADIRAFARYCQFAGLFERLMAELASEDLVVKMPNGVEGPNQKFKMALDCQNQADKLGRQFGLSPATRKNVPKPVKEEEENPFQRMFRESQMG